MGLEGQWDLRVVTVTHGVFRWMGFPQIDVKNLSSLARKGTWEVG